MNTVYRIISEWDFGEEYYVFGTSEAAKQWLLNNKSFVDFARDENQTPADCLAECTKQHYIAFAAYPVIS